MAEEKSGCQKFMSAIWQFPVFTCAWMCIALAAGFKMNQEAGDIQTEVNTGLAITGKDAEIDVKTGILWTLIGIIVIDGGVTFLSIVTSEWVHDCCWNNQMKKCPCCTQVICYALNWFLFGMTYLLGLLSLLFSGAGGLLITYAVANRGVCTKNDIGGSAPDAATAVEYIVAILESLKTFVCEDSSGNKMSGCDDFPTTIAEAQVPDFCTSMNNIIETGGTFFAWTAVLIVAQWSFAVIQRANLVESAARRDMAKKNNKEDGGDANYGSQDATGPNV